MVLDERGLRGINVEEPKPEPRVILGLDVSTETVGISLVVKDDDGTIIPVEVTHLKMKVPDKYKGAESLFMKNDIFREKLEELHSKYVIDSVVIEVLDERGLRGINVIGVHFATRNFHRNGLRHILESVRAQGGWCLGVYHH